MFYKLIEKYSNIIYNTEIFHFEKFSSAKAFSAKIEFKDRSILYIKDYLFLNGNRKYSYHWQNRNGKLIIRWDNSPHYSNLKTFPHHKHIGGDKVTESNELELSVILELNNRKIHL